MIVGAIVRAGSVPEAANETFNVGATDFGTVRTDLQALIDHAGSSSRLQPIPVRPAELVLRALELMRLSPMAEWHYKTAHRDSFVDVTKAERVLSRQREVRGGRLTPSEFGERMKGRGVYWQLVEQSFRVHCARLGFNQDEGPAYESRPSTFRRPSPQGSLFE